ncbi:Peroxidase [Mycena venus]|uniref:Peroxidase n=1 Tax=Mycena venus TaxID=2733690 RepID=A0A8H7DAH2_9AGAR|nr:Peroxidase [Mycena venus]
MRLALGIAFLALISAISSGQTKPPKRATCSKGRTSAFDIRSVASGSTCGMIFRRTCLTAALAMKESMRLFLQLESVGLGADGSMHHTDIEANYRESQAYYPAALLMASSRERRGWSVAFPNVSQSSPYLCRLSDESTELQQPIAVRHRVSFGDFIQFAGAVRITNCPGAPSLEFMAGRFNFSFASPDGFSPNEIVDLVVSHTVAAQDHVDPTSSCGYLGPLVTPGQFDSQFFMELLAGSAFPGNGGGTPERLCLRLVERSVCSPISPSMACEWQSFVSQYSLWWFSVTSLTVGN